MKKIFIIVMALICIMSFSIVTYAQGEYKNVSELYENWAINGFPDYVGSVYSTDGGSDNLTILLVDDNGIRADEIRLMLADASGVTFGKAEISYNEMLKVNNEIQEKYMGKDQNIYGVGLGWGIIDGKTTGFGKSKKESRVVLTVDESVAQEYANKFYEIYGDMVVVEAGSIVYDTKTAKESIGHNSWFILIVACLVAITGAVMYSKSRNFIPAIQTDCNTVTIRNVSMSRKQTIESIRASKITPDKNHFSAIMYKIDNHKK